MSTKKVIALEGLHGNANETHKENYSNNEELIKREEVKDSPFTIITINNESFGVMGQYRITEVKESPEEVKKELEEITWNRIIQVIMLINQKQ